MRLTFRGILSEEWTEYTALRCVANRGVVQSIDECRDTENVGEEDEFLPNGRTGLTDAGEELDRGHPFLGCQAIA